MVFEGAWRLGVGVALGWAALPFLVKLARRSRESSPADHYRALVAALAIATALVFAPLVRGWAGTLVELPAPGARGDGAGTSSVAFVTELVTPLLGTAGKPWPSMPLARLLSTLGSLWLVLLGVGIVASFAGHVRLRREYGKAAVAPARVREQAARIAAEMGIAAPPVRVADGLASAFTYGFVSPVIVLGSAACDMPDADLDFVLRHELCHVARHDTRAIYWIDLAQRCFTGHPSLSGLAAEIRLAREARVDEAAAGARPLEYARFLLTVAEHVCSARAPSPSLVSMADTALERRVEMLITPQNRTRLRRSLPWLGLAGLTLGSLVFLAPSSWAQPHGDDHPTVTGNLSVQQVEQAMFDNPRQVLDCYDALAAPRDSLSAHFSFEIAEDGRVRSGQARVPEHPELEPCLQAVLMNKTFPAPSSGTVQVEFPTELSPPYEERRAVAEAAEGNSQRIPPETIRAVVRSYYDQFRACYEPLIPSLPAASVTMSFTIGREGNVTDGEAKDVTPGEHDAKASAKLAQCIDGVMFTMKFPAPEDGIVTVAYPLMFTDGNEPPDQQPDPKRSVAAP
jgi:beta-lactamase regulating signal transducer with metallopeptidase domain